jgi:uncharacterized membrane protein HdeD (DUF308 family)
MLGVLFFVLGFLCILEPGIGSLAVTLLIGWIFVFAGVSALGGVFVGHGKHHPHQWLAALVGIVSLIAGMLLLIHPGQGVATLTIVAAIAIAVQGIIELVWAGRPELRGRRGWLVISGLCGLFLGFLVIAHWPTSAVWFLGLLFGIRLMFTGASFMSIHSIPPPPPGAPPAPA